MPLGNASGPPEVESPQVQAMSARLHNVPLENLKAQMVKAGVPGASVVAWKVDLITLAVQHSFVYVFRVGLAPPPTSSGAGAARPFVAPFIREHQTTSLQAATSPVHSAILKPSLSGAAALPSSKHQPAALEAATTPAYSAIPQQQPSTLLNQPPKPGTMGLSAAPVSSAAPTASAKVGKKRGSGHPEIKDSAILVSVNDDMGIAGKMKVLYEAKWTQVFAPTPLCRGFIFLGEHTFEEVRLEVQKMALASGCLFWKTDSFVTDSADGYVHSMTFKCPHFPDPMYYKPKKGRATEEEAAEPWRNESRNGQHVTGTKCGARFTINGKKSDVVGSDKYTWRISQMMRAKFSMEHSGHPEPYAKYLQKMVLSSSEKDSITNMVNAGMSSNQISAFLSNNGQKGAISKQTIGFISSEISKWRVELATIHAKKPGLSAAQALVENLQALPNCTVILLYKDVDSADNQLTSFIAGKSDIFKVTTAEMEDVTKARDDESAGGDESADAQPQTSSMLSRGWAACCAALKSLARHEPISGNTPKSQVSLSSENDRNRILTIDGKKCLLLALLWAFDEEQLMFSKYPEILHHDVKGKVCQWAMPWWFSVGVNGRRGNFIALRGWIHNESRAMFRFCEKALRHVHGKFLKFCICHCCDGDQDLIAVLLSMCVAGGSSPWARLIRCFWHIQDRGMIHEFKNLTDPWIKQLISILWRTCLTLETPQEFEKIWTWVVSEWMPRVTGKVKGLPVGERCSPVQAALLPDFLERIYITREYWCLAWKLTVPAMNTTVNTRAETENGVLVKHVGVSGGMTPGKMASGEARITTTAYQLEARSDFSHLNRASCTDNVCQKLMTAVSFEIQHNQVLIAQVCCNEGSSSLELCTEALADCETCLSAMLPHQGGVRNREQHALWFPDAIHDNVVARFHVKISYTEPIHHPRDIIEHVGAETVYAGCPWPTKRTRIVTVHLTNGIIYLLCSCGYDIREMCTCRHVSVILGTLTDGKTWGEEAIAIHLRHLIAFSYWNVAADLPARAAYDFMGTATRGITKEQLMEYNSIRELIKASTVPFEVEADALVGRITASTCSMRQAKQALIAPFNKLCNVLFKKLSSANTLSTLTANNAKGMEGLRILISQFPDSAVTSGDSTKRIKAAAERRGSRKKSTKTLGAGAGVSKSKGSNHKHKHLTAKK